MTERSQPWENQSIGDATLAPYSAAEWASYWNKLQGIGGVYANYGVLKGTGGGLYEPLEVRATTPASANVEVQVGAAMVNGRLYETDAVITLPVSANASGNLRIDTVVLRADFVLQTVRAAIKLGTPAGSPVPPTLTQNATTWEMPLANIRVPNGFSTIAQADIPQRRFYAHTADMGWVGAAYPLVYSPTAAFTTNLSIPANGGTILIPMVVQANMSLNNLTFHVRSTAIEITWGWDLYRQDLEDHDAANTILRRVAQSEGNETVTLGGSPSNRNLAAAGAGVTFGGVSLSPGLYWAAIQNRHATNAFNMGSAAASAEFSGTSARQHTTSNPNGGTLDTAPFILSATSILPVRLRGFALGTTPV